MFPRRGFDDRCPGGFSGRRLPAQDFAQEPVDPAASFCACSIHGPLYQGRHLTSISLPKEVAPGEPIDFTVLNSTADKLCNYGPGCGVNFYARDVVTGKMVANNEIEQRYAMCLAFWDPGTYRTYTWNQVYICPCDCRSVYDETTGKASACQSPPCPYPPRDCVDCFQVPEGTYLLHLQYEYQWWTDGEVFIGNKPTIVIEDTIPGIPDDDFANINHRKTLRGKAETVGKMMLEDNYSGAYQKLLHDMRPKYDGAGKDWVAPGESQEKLLTYTDNMLDFLESRM